MKCGFLVCRRVGRVRRFGKDFRVIAWRSVAAVAVVAAAFASPQADAKPKNSRTPAVAAAPQSKTPLILVVSLQKQKVRAFDADGEVTSSRVSSGRAGFATPTGVFSILQKNVDHTSNIYAADMPYMQRLTWSGIALHAGVVPGFRASHGCIRLPHQFSRKLFGITNIGTRVVVTNEETTPIPFSSPKLFNPLPADDAGAMNLAAAQNPRLASNDTGDKDSSSATDALEFPMLIGITPALARAVADMPRDPGRRPATRLELDQMRRETAARVRSDLKIAEMTLATANDKAKAAEKDFSVANAELVKAQRAGEPAKAALKTAEAQQQEAIRDFQAFMANDSDSAAASDREAQLENEILLRTREADAARNAAAKGEMNLAELQARVFMLRATRDATSEAIRQAQTDLKSAQADVADSDNDARLSSKPISVFVSLKAQRLYIRQGFEPVLEAPITVTPDAGQFGTHVFTAMRYGTDPNTFDWRLVTAQKPPASRRGRTAAGVQPSSNVELATAALNAFEMPKDLLAMLSERARPGASLIISDRELPLHENGSGTEFVILTK